MKGEIEKIWDKMEKKGIRAERLQLEWCSAAEALKWRKVMLACEELRKTVTKEEIEKTKEVLLEELEKKKKRKQKRREAAAPPV